MFVFAHAQGIITVPVVVECPLVKIKLERFQNLFDFNFTNKKIFSGSLGEIASTC